MGFEIDWGSSFGHVWVVEGLFDADSFVLTVFQHGSYKLFTFFGDRGSHWEVHFDSIEHDLLLKNLLLAHLVSKGFFAVNKLIKDDSD